MADLALSWATISVKDNFLDCTCERGVYVIRTIKPYIINYRKGLSPTIYIGRGNVADRLYYHMEWIKRLIDTFDGIDIEIMYCTPRLRGSKDIYKDVEADLLSFFGDKYKDMPLKNWRPENAVRDNRYTYEDIDYGISKVPRVQYTHVLESAQLLDDYGWLRARSSRNDLAA